MITGVAKRMAGQFFKAIDDELTGVVRRSPPPPRPLRPRARLPLAALPLPRARRSSPARRRPPRARCRRRADARCSAPVGGALLTLIGVLVGYRLGRRVRLGPGHRRRPRPALRIRAPIAAVPTLRRTSVPDGAALPADTDVIRRTMG